MALVVEESIVFKEYDRLTSFLKNFLQNFP